MFEIWLIVLSKRISKSDKNRLAEERVNLAIEITDACVHVCADAVRERYPTVGEEELLELLRERVMYGRRRRREV